MGKTLKRKLLGYLLAVVMTFSCLTVLMAIPSSVNAENTKTTYLENFENSTDYQRSDPSFVKGSTNGKGSSEISTNYAKSGTNSLHFKAAAGSSASKLMVKIRNSYGQVQSFNGQKYHISFYYYIPSAATEWDLCYTFCSVYDYGINQANFGSQNELNTIGIGNKAVGQWHRADVVFTASKVTGNMKYLLLYLQGKNGKEVYIDDVSVTKIDGDDNVVIVNTPAGEKAVYGKAGDDYASQIDTVCNNQQLTGFYKDETYSTAVSSTVFGEETTPVTSNIPTMVYAKYEDKVRAEYNFSFDNYADGYAISAKSQDSSCSFALSGEKSKSGDKSLKYTGTTAWKTSYVRLDMSAADDAEMKVGTTYVVSFKYFIESTNEASFYYNFALADKVAYNWSSSKNFGWQMLNGDYWGSKKINGTSADGWQTATVQFTARKGDWINTPNRLIMSIQTEIAGAVYIDDLKVTELFDNEYAVIKNENNGSEPVMQIGAAGTMLDLGTPELEGCSFIGWYTDPDLTSMLAAAQFGADDTPVNNYIPFNVYAKYIARAKGDYTLDFDNYAEGYAPSTQCDSGISVSISDEKSISGTKSLKIAANAKGKANVRLDMKAANDVKLNVGSKYVVSFRYFVDSDSNAEIYYNFALTNSTALRNSLATNGWQMINGDYWASKSTSGTSADGWQTATVQFTARQGNFAPNMLVLSFQANIANKTVYIDDMKIKELAEDEYVIRYDTAGGNEIDYAICKAGEKVYIPESPVRNPDVFENWYTDSNYTSVYKEQVCSDENTPVTNYIPFTLYAKFIASIPKKIDFENFDISKTVYGTSNKESSMAISSVNKYAGNSALEITSTATSNSKAVTKNIILLKSGDRKVKLNKGKSYIVSFKYFIDSQYVTTTYYNYVLRNSNSYGNALSSTTKANGIMMYNDQGYQSAIPLSGTSANGWQSTQAAFTANADEDAKTYLYLYVQTKSPCKVYIDDVEITEIGENQNVVQFKSNNSFVGGRIVGERGSQFSYPSIKREGFKLLGWYYDEKFEKPAKNIHPNEGVTTLYAKWEATVTVVDSVNFENWDFNTAVYKTSTDPKTTLEFSTEKAHNGKISLKFASFGSSDSKANSKAAIVLSDGETKCQVNKGKNYLVSFWYYVDAENDSQIYYNFATTSSTTIGNLLLSTVQKNGIQLYNGEGYATSQKLYGNSKSGWQKAVCVFTATTTDDAKNFLAFYIQANKVTANVYIDDFSIQEVSDDVGMVVFMPNGGKPVEPIIGKIGQTVSLPNCEPMKNTACFYGWYTNTKYEEKLEKVTLAKEPTVVYARFVFGYSIMDFDEGYCYADRTKYGMAISKEGKNLDLYTPSTVDYDPSNVHSGKNSIHRYYDNDDAHSVLSVMNWEDNVLTVGEEYTLRYWVKCTSMFSPDSYMQISYGTDKTNGWNRIASDPPNICKVKKVGTDEWVQVAFTFTAKARAICFRTMGANELYFDDFEIMWSKYPGYDKFIDAATVKCVESDIEIETIGFNVSDNYKIFSGDFKLEAIKVNNNNESSSVPYIFIAAIVAGVLIVGGGVTFICIKKSRKRNKTAG